MKRHYYTPEGSLKHYQLYQAPDVSESSMIKERKGTTTPLTPSLQNDLAEHKQLTPAQLKNIHTQLDPTTPTQMHQFIKIAQKWRAEYKFDISQMTRG